MSGTGCERRWERERSTKATASPLHHADCLDVLRSLPDCSVDSVVCDPPHNLAFMGKAWDDHASAVGFQQWCEL